MPDFRKLNSQLVAGLKNALSYTDIRLGYLGKISAVDTINPTPSDGLDQGYVWVRFDNNTEAIRARCHKISARMPDMPVRVGRDVLTKEWTVIEIVPADYGAIDKLASTFSVPDRNPDLIYEEFDANRFRDLHVEPGDTAFDVNVEEGFYWWQGSLIAFEGGTVNIASSVPTGGYGGSKRGVLIGIDPATNTLTTYDGDTQGILVTPGNEGKYFTATYIADTVNAADVDIYWIALIPLTSNDSNWQSLYRVTALTLVNSLGAALTGHGIRVNDVDQTQRGFINFLGGNGVAVAGADDSANDEIVVGFEVNEAQLSLANLGTRVLDNLSDVDAASAVPGDVLLMSDDGWIASPGYISKTRVSSADTTPDYLSATVQAGNGITTAIVSPAGDEKLSFTVNEAQLSLANLGTRLLDNLSDVILTSAADGQLLQRSGGNWVNVDRVTILPQWGALAYHSANITHNSTGNWFTITTLDSEFWDTDGIHSLVTNTGRLTFQRAGIYSLSGSIWWTGNATGSRGLGFIKNATPIWQEMEPATAGWHFQTTSTNYQFSVGDYVELRTWQDSGGNLNMLANSVFGIALQAQWIGQHP